MRTIVVATVGLVPWIAAQWIAFLISAGGHGWVAPFFYSVPLVVLYPLTLTRAFSSRVKAAKLDLAVVLVAVLLDALLFGSTMSAEYEYFLDTWNAGSMVLLWLGLWFGWQVVAVSSLRKNRRSIGEKAVA